MARTPYLGNQAGSTGRTPYLGPTSAPKKSGGGGGIFGGIKHAVGEAAHVAGQTATDLEQAAINSPAGLYKIGKDIIAPGTHPSWAQLGHQYVQAFTHPGSVFSHENIAADPLAQDIVAMGKQGVQAAEHPLRHPGYTALYALPVLSGAAKLGIATRAGATGAKGAAIERSLSVPGLTVHPEAAKTGIGQVLQKASDVTIQKAAAKKPGGRAESVLHHKIRKVVTAEARQATRSARGPGYAIIRMGRRLTPGEQKALEVVAEEAPLAKRITAASARVTGARNPVSRAGHQTDLDLLHQAREHLTGDTGKPGFSSAKLQAVYDKMASVAGDRETLLKNLKLLTDEAIVARKAKAGRVAMGAHYVEPTPGKLGVPSAALTRQRAYVERLGGLHERAVAKAQAAGEKLVRPGQDVMIGGKVVGPGIIKKVAAAGTRTVTKIVPRTEKEAQAYLAALEKEHTAAVDTIRRSQFGEISKQAEAGRTRTNRAIRGAQTGLTKTGKQSGSIRPIARKRIKPSILEEQRRTVEKQIDDAIAKDPSLPERVPQVKAWLDRRAEIEQLQAALAGTTEPAWMREPGSAPAGSLGTKEVTRTVTRPARTTTGPGRVVTPTGGARAERLGGALSVARDRLEQLEAKRLRRMEPTGLLGHEEFQPSAGAVRVPDFVTRRGARGLGATGRLGAQGTIGHLRPPGSTTHEYRGLAREYGIRRQQTSRLNKRYSVTQAVGESYLEAAKYAGLLHLHDLYRQVARANPFPRRADDVAVRLDNLGANEKMPLAVRQFISDPEEFFTHGSPAQQASALDAVRQQLFIAGHDEGTGAGWQPTGLAPEARAEFERLAAEGKIGWVPKRMLGELAGPAAPLRAVMPAKVVSSIDAINNASRFAILYLKPAYAIPNILGNAALTIVQQGFAAPRNLAQATKLLHRLPDETYARIDSAMGEGVARSISAHGVGPFSKIVDFSAGKWSWAVDMPFRRASFLYRAREAGYKTPKQIDELLQRPATDPELTRIGISANRDLIDYENLNATEREVIRRVVFFYPWVKGSTIVTGRIALHHPVTTAAIGAAGQLGQQWSQQHLGAAPSYYQGLIPVGANRAINPTSSAIMQTPAQALMAAQGLLTGNVGGAASLANNFTPALSLAEALRTRTDPATGIPYKPGQRGFGNIAQDQLLGSLPQVTLARGLTGHGRGKVFPPSPSNAIGNFLLGGVYPRTINKAALNRSAASEAARIKSGR